MAGDHQLRVFINPLKLFEWEKEPIPDLPKDPTPERLLQFLCPHGAAADMPGFKARYRQISAKDQDLPLSIEEPGIVANLIGPLRQAKTNYVLGNYVGAIALCGIVAEKVAILVHAVNTPNEQERESFAGADQGRRVDDLKNRQLISPESVQDFGHIRGARKKYLHYWTEMADERIANEALQAYAAAIRLVCDAMGINVVAGALKLNAALMRYLTERGALRPRSEES